MLKVSLFLWQLSYHRLTMKQPWTPEILLWLLQLKLTWALNDERTLMGQVPTMGKFLLTLILVLFVIPLSNKTLFVWAEQKYPVQSLAYFCSFQCKHIWRGRLDCNNTLTPIWMMKIICWWRSNWSKQNNIWLNLWRKLIDSVRWNLKAGVSPICH